jgi:hypothetical protein
MYDFVESKCRTLDALDVDQATYATFVPSLLEKLPDSLGITMTRGEEHHEWDMEKFLDVLGGEIDLQEGSTNESQTGRNDNERTGLIIIITGVQCSLEGNQTVLSVTAQDIDT